MNADIAVGEGQGLGNAGLILAAPMSAYSRRGPRTCDRCGTARRRDGRRGGSAQLRAYALDPRAAHPPREGDEQHLHQLGLMRARILDPVSRCLAALASDAWRKSITPTRFNSPSGSLRFHRSNCHTHSSTSSSCARRGRRNELIEALAARASSWFAYLGLLPGAARRLRHRRSTETNTEDDERPMRKRLPSACAKP